MRKSIIQRENKRTLIRFNNFKLLRLTKRSFKYYYKTIKHLVPFSDSLKFNFQLQFCNANLFDAKKKNRCFISGRSRGFNRFFGLSRHNVKNLFSKNFLSGLRKSSW